MADPCLTAPPAGCSPTGVTDSRVLGNFTRRFNTASKEALQPIEPHPTNNDEATYADKCGTYTKCVLQDSPGKVNLAAFTKFRNAINSGQFVDFEAVPLGGARTLNGPMGAYAASFVGADSSQFGVPTVPAAPALASKSYATELVELYWCSLLRDVAFSDYTTSQVAIDAAKELSTLHATYAGPTNGGTVTPALLFRGSFPGETIGPYISQLIITPTNLGAQAISQTYQTYKAGLDYMTDLATWSDVQNGISTGYLNVNDPTPRILHNGRGLAAFTHVDELFQAYFTAYLVLRSSGVPVNPGSPYATSKTQNGFGTFGPPDFASVLAQVAKTALNAVWFQKWVVHLRHRPESGGGMVHLINQGVHFDGSPDGIIFHSKALAQSHTKYGSYLLSQPFPEGSPAHPAYPTGHGTVGGACLTILKFFFDGGFVFPNPVNPSSDGLSLEMWGGGPEIGAPGPLTVNGELHKLAHNITFGHGLHGGIHWRSDSDSSIQLGEAVALRFLDDLVCTYEEPFNVSITLLDGSTRTFTNV